MESLDANYFEDVICEDIAASEIRLYSAASRDPDYGKNEPYSNLVSWKDWEKKHGVPRPYETPFDEYVQNAHTSTRSQIELRWSNMPEQDDVGSFWNTPKALIARARFQAASLSGEDIAFSSAPETINRERYLDLLFLQAEKKKIEVDLEAEKRIVRERVGNPSDGYSWEEIERAVTISDKSQLRRDLILVQNAIDSIREKPKVDGGVDSGKEVGDIYMTVMTVNNHVGSLGIPINDVQAEIARREKALMEGDAQGRVYDAQAVVTNTSV